MYRASLLLLIFVVATVAVERTSILETPSGLIQGVVENGAKIFYAIPFAAPPVGERRWKAPEMLKRWDDVQAATTYAPGCMQNGYPAGKVVGSEDCLYLNVFVPANASTSSSLPVRVWFYGGGFQMGRTTDYPADLLAVESNSIIVSTSYRVNIFGFFALPQLVSENPVLNYGLQDQQVALSWVQRNIASFGGDPTNVMIFGESAGGGSVSLHLLMKKSWPLYHKAVLESPGPWWYTSLPTANSLCQSMIDTIPSCNTSSPSGLLACLRGVSAEELLSAYNYGFLDYGGCTNPCIDNQQLMDSPGKLFTEGLLNPEVPLLIGGNLHEGNLLTYIQVAQVFNTSNLTLTESEYEFLFSNIVPQQFRSAVAEWYDPLVQSSGYWHAMSQLQGDFFIDAGTCLVVNGAARAGNPVFRYVFTEPTVNSTINFLNVTHGSEVSYVFDNPKVFLANSFTPSEQALADTIVGYWTRFHKTGNPNGDNAPEWPQYRVGVNKALVLNEKPATVDNWGEPWCSLWKPILQGAA